jgi:hypothetical protein
MALERPCLLTKMWKISIGRPGPDEDARYLEAREFDAALIPARCLSRHSPKRGGAALADRLSPAQLKTELRAQFFRSDLVLIELVRRATGQSPEANA